METMQKQSNIPTKEASVSSLHSDKVQHKSKHPVREIINVSWPVLFFLLLLFIVKISEKFFAVSFVTFGIQPKTISGVKGIFLSPFIHGDWAHLINNAIPLLIMGTALFYFYRPIAWKTLFWIWLMQGFWTWIAARDAFHIGSSGLVYGLFGFLLLSGLLRMHKALLVISLLVVFQYGSMVWGIFPIKYQVSWEAHLWGMMAGIALAWVFRKQGKQREVHVWEEEEEDIADETTAERNKSIQVHYTFVEKKSNHINENKPS